MIRNLLRGGVAGAAGTTVLNAVTYADMAYRGRGSSGAPGEVVDRLADDTGHPVPGSGDTRTNRLTGLGALSGIAAGCGTGVAVALLHGAGLRLPWWLGGPLTGALAMAAADLPLAGTGVSDPRTWSAKDWASDVVPHLAYGLVTYAVATSGENRG
ncbi:MULTISPECIES: hypothetical protein [Streptomyces]|uniref:hypothetical protein n=1 Tax=Streptomyces TaxID=1883 RepID=UPI0018ACDAF2|nr:hypothetical protein [Streptomyces sp. BRB081]MBL3808059.1 hypothetical protein [Streptomyces sp. BRB081]